MHPSGLQHDLAAQRHHTVVGDVAIVGDLGLVARQPNEQTRAQAAEFALWRQGQAVAGKEE